MTTTFQPRLTIPLQGEREVTRYGNVFRIASEALSKVYASQEGKPTTERLVIGHYLERVINTFEALRLRHLFADDDSLFIDAEGSGLPHYDEIDQLERELLASLTSGPPGNSAAATKAAMLDRMMKEKTDPVGLLPELARRLAFDVYARLPFFQYNEGSFVRSKDGSYLYHWACYDRATNRPYIYLMVFDTTYDACFLGTDEEARIARVIKSEGHRAPRLNVLASSIDSQLERVHPKLVKRIGIGPFYANLPGEVSPPDVQRLLSVGTMQENFVLFVDHEHVFSGKQVRTPGGLLSKGQLREIFVVPTHMATLYERGVSGYEKIVVLPYQLHQHSAGTGLAERTYSVTKKGDVYGVDEH